MKREIQFRGKRELGKEWVYGDLLRFKWDTYIWTSDALEPWNARLVDPDTVGWYTGLTDKNGTRIFEGDVLRYVGGDKEVLCVIQWADGSAGFWMKERKTGAFGPMDRWESCRERWEVIGNIWDNPELLEGESQ